MLYPELYKLVELAECLFSQSAVCLVFVQLELLEAVAQLGGAERIVGRWWGDVDGVTHTVVLLSVN